MCYCFVSYCPRECDAEPERDGYEIARGERGVVELNRDEQARGNNECDRMIMVRRKVSLS